MDVRGPVHEPIRSRQRPVPGTFQAARFSFQQPALLFQAPGDLFHRRPILFHRSTQWNIASAAATARHGGNSARGINDLRPEEYRKGATVLTRKIRRYRPAIVAVVGVTVWRALLEALGEPRARTRSVAFGFQSELATPDTRYFVLPNPSGRNANYTYGEMLAAYKKLAAARRATRPT